MAKGMLRFGDENELVSRLRKALDLGPYDPVEVITSQIERTDGKKITFIPPKKAEFFDSLKTAPVDLLIDLGMEKWNDEILLFPGEWYDFIPNGYKVLNIFGDEEIFEHGKTDNGTRYGCLSFGFKPLKSANEGDAK